MSRLVRRALAVLVSTVCVLPAAQPAFATAAPPQVVRVMPLGDSITLGIGSSTGSGYRLPLWQLTTTQSRYTVQFVGSQYTPYDGFPQPWHEGHGGWTIDDIARHVDGWLAAQSPDVVLLHIGTNDLDHGTDREHAPDRLAALVDRIFADRPGVALVLQGLLPTTRGMEEQVRRYNLRAVKLTPALVRAGRHFQYVAPPELSQTEFHDRLHPNDLGYARMAAVWFQALNTELDSPQQLPVEVGP